MVFVSRSRLVQAATGPTAGGTGTSSRPSTLIPISPSLEKATQAQLATYLLGQAPELLGLRGSLQAQVFGSREGLGFSAPSQLYFAAPQSKAGGRPALLHLLSCNIWGFV